MEKIVLNENVTSSSKQQIKNIKEKIQQKELDLARRSQTKPIIELRDLEKHFDNKAVLKSVNLKIYEGEFITILGPSGSGKSTILSLLGGFEYPTRGEIIIQGKDVKDLPAHKRPTSTIFQDYALFTHLDVAGNIKYGLKLIRKPVPELVTKNKSKLENLQAQWAQKQAQKIKALQAIQAEYEQKLTLKEWSEQRESQFKSNFQKEFDAASSSEQKELVKKKYKKLELEERSLIPINERAKIQKWMDNSDFKYSYWENYTNLKKEQFERKHTTRALSKKEIDDRVNLMLKLVNLQGNNDKNILSLSGGMRQRVALARSLAISPKILLLDEPLSALDAKIRTQMQRLLVEIQEELGLTFIFVTHDQKEAIELSSRIIVIRDGNIEQFDVPEKIYDYPVNKWVANFIGESNFFEGTYQGDGKVKFLNRLFRTVHTDQEFSKEQVVDILIRPEDITLSVKQQEGFLSGKIINWTYKGSYYISEVDLGTQSVFTESTDFFDYDTVVYLRWDIDDMHLMKQETNNTITQEMTYNATS